MTSTRPGTTAPESTGAVILQHGSTQVVLDLRQPMPVIVHLGPPIPSFDPQLLDQPVAHATLDSPAPLGIITEHGYGFGGRPGLMGNRSDGSGWSPLFTEADPPVLDPPVLDSPVLDSPVLDSPSGQATSARFSIVDPVAELRLGLEVSVTEAETVVISAQLTNEGDTPYALLRLSPSVPVPIHANDLVTFSGRWCREFQPDRSSFDGLTVLENRRGRTSHEQLPAVFAGTFGFGEDHGDVWGIQLAWSGNYEVAAERISDGRRHIQAGELLAPGEVTIEPADTYRSPDVVVAASGDGISPASQRFHRHVRTANPLDGPRKVILNTWEAVYFNHDLDTLKALADAGAEVGVERFVLDDGWFGSRRDDTRGLGDWWVSEEVWPNGLHPIVDHVVGLGMEFGLWLEPEMVNPDSELYREHPDWALTTPGYEPVLGRHQLVLDCGRGSVRHYLFDRIDALLREYPIAYLKWDMNRDLVHGSYQPNPEGPASPGAHGHVLGVYKLIDRLRAAHPGVEIESCASGGGRVDLGILRRTDRVWTSDCNDALERQDIQRGFSMLFPPEVMGAHIGPERAHTTHRVQNLGFRCATALFGSLGIEWNLLEAGPERRARVAATVTLYKRLRTLLHGGDVVRVDHDDPAVRVHGVVATDRSRAVMAYVQAGTSPTTIPMPFHFAGLDPERRYRIELIDDLGSVYHAGRVKPRWMSGQPVATGEQLMRSGLQPPVLHPESVLLLELTAVDA